MNYYYSAVKNNDHDHEICLQRDGTRKDHPEEIQIQKDKDELCTHLQGDYSHKVKENHATVLGFTEAKKQGRLKGHMSLTVNGN